MKLSQNQTNRVWQLMFEAEVRSLYFGELTSRYTTLRQIITGASLFLSSGAAATIAAKTPSYIPIILASVTAVLSAYAIAVGLDRKIAALGKLHGTWHNLQTSYENLWNHWFEDDADELYEKLRIEERSASEAGLEMPYQPTRLKKWMEFTSGRYKLNAA
jgi:hypothetical protein